MAISKKTALLGVVIGSYSSVVLLSGCNFFQGPCLKPVPPKQAIDNSQNNCMPCPPCPACPEPSALGDKLPLAKPFSTRIVGRAELCGFLEPPEDIEAIKKAARLSLNIINSPDNNQYFQGEKQLFSKERLSDTINVFLNILDTPSATPFCDTVFDNFDVLEISGQNGQDMLVTGYFQPVIEASLTRDETFKHPIFSPPQDLVKVNLKDFDQSLPSVTLFGRLKDNSIVPYSTRQEIEKRLPTEENASILAWLKSPVDSLTLHIQGSGILRLPDRSQRFVHYSANNGWPYGSVGKWLIDRGYIQKNKASWQDIEVFAQKQPEIFQGSFQANPRYIFFEWAEKGPIGAYGELLHDRLSAALDPAVYPPGAIFFLKTSLPDEARQIHTVFNHDKGAAIQGSTRIDLYTGTGMEAGELAGKLKNKGKIFALLAKKRI